LKNPEILIILTVTVVVGTIALPQTLTLFVGQHYWYNLSDPGNDIPCEKCHADIAEEMSQIISAHAGETTGEVFDCGYCHRTFPVEGYKDSQPSTQSDNINDSISDTYSHTYALVEGSTYHPGIQAHAASTIPCLYCHSGENNMDSAIFPHPDTFEDCLSCHDGGHEHDSTQYFSNQDCRNCHAIAKFIPPAGGFGWTTNESDSGEMEAHNAFITQSMRDTTLEHCNEACIACHTAIPVKINWNHSRSLEFDIGLEDEITTEYGPHNWTLTDWGPNGTASSTTWGNVTGSGSTTYNEEEWPGSISNIYD